jgi:hypothetical protein
MGVGSFTGDNTGFLRNVFGFSYEFYEKVFGSVIGKHAFTIAPVMMRPKSRGRIFLKSANPFHWPHLQPMYFTNPKDIVTLREGVKIAIQVGESKAFKKFGSRLHSVPL